MLGQNGSSRLDTVLKMLLIAFVSLLAFSSGVYFGKQMSDSEYQLKALEKDFNDNEKVAAGEEASGEEAAPQDAMIDEEIAQLSNKYMKNSEEAADVDGDEAAARDVASTSTEKKVEHKEAHAAKASNETASIHKGKVDLNDVKKVAERVVNNQTPTVPAKEDKPRKPASLPKVGAPTSTAEYTVQVASYPDEAQAQTHAADLVKKGFPAYPIEATIKGKTWYRVSVGSFKTQKDATEYRSQLMKQANLSSAIVQKIDR